MEASATQDRIKGEFKADYPVEKLNVHPKNARIGDVGKIADSLQHFGQARPIVISNDGLVIAGNHTFKAAKELGWDGIDVYEMPWDYDTAFAYLMADNRIGDLGTYDGEQLHENLVALMEADRLEATGYTADDVDDLASELGKVAETAGASGAEHAEDPEETAKRYKSAGNEGGAPAVPMKELMLIYPNEQFDEVAEAVNTLKKAWGVDGTRDVVAEALKRAVANETTN